MAPIVISPPLEYVSIDFPWQSSAVWYFPRTSLQDVDQLFHSIGIGGEDAAQLRGGATEAPEIDGIVVKAPADVVARLSPDVRARLYVQLAKSASNVPQAQAFRYEAATFDAWLGRASIAPATRDLVRPLVYRSGSHQYFADLDHVQSRIPDPEEVRRLVKALYRQPTVLVRVSLSDPADVASVSEYWGRGGRRTDVRPLLESLASSGPGASIDIVHLLPTFARNHLYRYPKLKAEDFDKPIIANCLWSALNFFNSTPDDRFLEVAYALDRLKRDYYVVEAGFELGDIIVFLNSRDAAFHVAVYLADNLVFTKNGTSPMAPWTIMPLESVKGYYRTHVETPRLMVHRRNGF
jgi:hypothetical protein